MAFILLMCCMVTGAMASNCDGMGCRGRMPRAPSHTSTQSISSREPWARLANKDAGLETSTQIIRSRQPWSRLADTDAGLETSTQSISSREPWARLANTDAGLETSTQSISSREPWARLANKDAGLETSTQGIDLWNSWARLADKDAALETSTQSINKDAGLETSTETSTQSISSREPWARLANKDADNDASQDMLSMPGIESEGIATRLGRVQWFNSSDDLLRYFNNKLDENHVAFVTPKSMLSRKVEILSVRDIPRDSVIMTCHTNLDVGYACHDPFHSQQFFLNMVRFVDDNQVTSLVFTEHQMDPGCSGSDCEMMHHVTESVVLKKYVLQDYLV